MALTILKQRLRQVHAGQNGYIEVSGLAQFTDDDATGELEAQIQNIECIQLTPVGEVDDDEQLFVDEAASVVDGTLQRPADTNSITIGRTGATPTADLVFAFLYRGY